MSEPADVITVRRATLADRDAVIDINVNVYDGVDYLPTLYEHVIRTPDRYAVFVAECDKKLVGLINFGIVYGGGVASVMSMRVRPEYQGRGVTKLIRKQFLLDFPNVTHFLMDGRVTESARRKVDKMQLLFKSNLNGYHINRMLLRDWVTHQQQQQQQQERQHQQSTMDRVHHLTVAECHQLILSGQLQQLLGRYANEYLPVGGFMWEPVGITAEHLTYWTKTMSTCVTFTEKQHYTAKPELDAVSLSTRLILKTSSLYGQVLINIWFYGHDPDLLVSHVRRQMCHLMANDVEDDVGNQLHRADVVNFRIHVPLNLESSLVAERLETPRFEDGSLGLGFMIPAYTIQVYLAREPAAE